MNKPQLPDGSRPSYALPTQWKQLPLGLMSEYRVQFDIFEGPLDLLLHLVKKQEVDIYQVNLTQIAVDFVAYIDQMRRLDLEVAGEFLVMAATLLYIKSRELLPADQQVVVQETDEEEIDPRRELIRRLVEYKKFKDAAAQLQVRETEMDGTYQRRPGSVEIQESAPTRREPMSVFDLISAVSTILKRFGDRGDVGEIAADPYTVSQKIEYLLEYVRERSVCRFSDLFAAAKTKVEVVVTFLALLELTRLRQIVVTQIGEFDEIEIGTAPDPNQPSPAASGAAESGTTDSTTTMPETANAQTTESTSNLSQAELALANEFSTEKRDESQSSPTGSTESEIGNYTAPEAAAVKSLEMLSEAEVTVAPDLVADINPISEPSDALALASEQGPVDISQDALGEIESGLPTGEPDLQIADCTTIPEAIKLEAAGDIISELGPESIDESFGERLSVGIEVVIAQPEAEAIPAPVIHAIPEVLPPNESVDTCSTPNTVAESTVPLEPDAIVPGEQLNPELAADHEMGLDVETASREIAETTADEAVATLEENGSDHAGEKESTIHPPVHSDASPTIAVAKPDAPPTV